MKLSTLIFAFTCLFAATNLSAQEEPKKDEKKIQEVINMEAEPLPQQPLADGSIPADTSGPKLMAQSEILKRAVNFVKAESKKYTKAKGITTGSKAECIATFNYKPKELNPQADVQGTFTMHISIDAKEGKYRYTISKISHIAKNPVYSGEDIFNEIPACGSLKLPPDLWKRLRNEALKSSAIIVNDLKEAMKNSSSIPVNNTDEW